MNTRGKPIYIYRNMGFQYSFNFQAPAAASAPTLTNPFPSSGPVQTSPQTLTGYGLAFMIFSMPLGYNVPQNPSDFTPPSPITWNPAQAGQLTTPIYTNTNPAVSEPGSFVFQMTAIDTAALFVGTMYRYQVLYIPPQMNPTLCKMGDVRVYDAPVFPSFTPAT